jgi:aerobic-type carbon monoxide dehydrogenase small subunit (CoxS/CutS family)
MRIEAVVNGRKVARDAAPHQRLLDFLRDDMHLTGAKDGCGAGECGACSVFVDGVLMKSCLMPVGKAQGAKIDTVEGLAQKGDLSLLQRAFHKTGASQCGYCIPGMVMAATAALRAILRPLTIASMRSSGTGGLHIRRQHIRTGAGALRGVE